MGLTAGAKAILWLDLETTGSDVDYDEIIEVGALVTDFEFNQIGQPYQTVVKPNDKPLGRLVKNEVVMKMHTDNGLLSECVKGRSLDKVDDELYLWVADTVRGDPSATKFILAGSGVSHFDRKFVDKYLPRLKLLLVYPTLDVGVVRRFLRFAGALPKQEDKGDPKSHRALDDIVQHLEEARYYKGLVRSMGVGL